MNEKIAVVGAGGVGGYFGVQMALAGRDVHFLPRSDYDAVHRSGWKIASRDHGSLHLENPYVYRHASDGVRTLDAQDGNAVRLVEFSLRGESPDSIIVNAVPA